MTVDVATKNPALVSLFIDPGQLITLDANFLIPPGRQMLRGSIEAKIYPYTNYQPQLNNHQDRGEVKTLAYIAVKGLLYFAAHDHNAIQLVEKAELLSTGLDTVQAIRMYEIIFFLYVKNTSIRKSLRMLYKYQYYLTKREKSTNPEWGVFIKDMESLYQAYL